MDLNADIGEGFEFDTPLMTRITSANIGLGAHAGTWELTVQTTAAARSAGVLVGLHPGFPDREHMGRRNPPAEMQGRWINSLVEQIEHGLELGPDYIKLHGAAYNLTASGDLEDPALVACIHRLGVPLMGLPNTEHERLADSAGVRLIREGFADRRYTPEGRLVPRNIPGAVLTDPADVADQVRRLIGVVDSICLHGDGPHCVEFADRIRSVLEAEGIEVRAWR